MLPKQRLPAISDRSLSSQHLGVLLNLIFAPARLAFVVVKHLHQVKDRLSFNSFLVLLISCHTSPLPNITNLFILFIDSLEGMGGLIRVSCNSQISSDYPHAAQYYKADTCALRKFPCLSLLTLVLSSFTLLFLYFPQIYCS